MLIYRNMINTLALAEASIPSTTVSFPRTFEISVSDCQYMTVLITAIRMPRASNCRFVSFDFSVSPSPGNHHLTLLPGAQLFQIPQISGIVQCVSARPCPT